MNETTPVTHHTVAVIGGGQAGLSISWHLKQSGIDHVVFEKERAGHAWRDERWDAFCLVTPNWQCKLPGFLIRDLIRTVSCCAMKLSPIWMPLSRPSIPRCGKASTCARSAATPSTASCWTRPTVFALPSKSGRRWRLSDPDCSAER